MSRYLSLTFGFLLCLALPASAQTPSPEAMATARNPYGDGYAAEQIVERIRRYFREVGTDRKAA